MPEFAWEAKARTGEVRRGVMEADTADAVQARLKQQNLAPVRVRKKAREFHLSIGSPVSQQDLVVFVRQFATMIDAGLPLVQCLDILASQGSNSQFNTILRDVKGFVEGGGTFSEALRRHPKVFDELFVNMIAAGEAGGILDTILNRLAVYIEKRVKLRRQVRGAMVYPTAVFIIAALVMVILLTYVVPTFEQMFKDFNNDNIPALTAFVIGLSKNFIAYSPFIVVGLVIVASTIMFSYSRPRGKWFWHSLMLGFPILGPVMRKISVARFTRTLGTLLASGVPILEALKIVGKTAGNVVIERAIAVTASRIQEGRTMAEPLMEAKVFPPMVVQMIGVGEQTGALDQMLNKIADFYEDEVEVAVAALTRLLEPIMMVVIGGMVGFMLVAMYMPIFDIPGTFKGE